MQCHGGTASVKTAIKVCCASNAQAKDTKMARRNCVHLNSPMQRSIVSSTDEALCPGVLLVPAANSVPVVAESDGDKNGVGSVISSYAFHSGLSLKFFDQPACGVFSFLSTGICLCRVEKNKGRNLLF